MDATKEYGENRFKMAAWIVVVLFAAAEILKLLYMTPYPGIGGDSLSIWTTSQKIMSRTLDWDFLGNNPDHHRMRWTLWLSGSAMISLFSDGVASYFAATFIPSTIAGCIFIFVIVRNFGIIPGAFFAIVFFFDPELYRSNFQLMPSGGTLLPLGLIILAFHLFLNEKVSKNLFATFLVVGFFLLYGAKASNLFFGPGLLVAILVLAGLRSGIIFCVGFVLLYGVETALLHAAYGQFPMFGRIAQLVSPDNQHMQSMTSWPNLVAQQEALNDAGIFSRWYKSKAYNFVAYCVSIPLFLVSIAVFARSINKRRKFIFAAATTGMSFVFFTSFFIVSLDPLRLGQSLQPRYLAHLLPISYFVIAGFIWLWFSSRRALLIAVPVLAAVIGVVVLQAQYTGSTPSRYVSRMAAHYVRDFGYKDTGTLSGWQLYFRELGQNMPETICAPIDQRSKLLGHNLRYIATADRNANYDAIMKSDVREIDGFYIRGKGDTCEGALIIYENGRPPE